MNARVEMDVVLPHPPERVWRALTDRRTLAEWLMPNDFEPRVGRRFRFRPKSGRGQLSPPPIACQVVEVMPGERLAYSWRERPDELPDLVTWTLEPVESGTRLRLEHTAPMAVVASLNHASTLWCGAAIRLDGLLFSRFVMGRVIPVPGGDLVRAVSVRRVDGERGAVTC
jgi:uncharacterized protein YndB with AHSA1/START domain